MTYDAELLEGVVFLEVRRLEQNGQRLLAERYHRARTKLYALAEDDRPDAFFQLHLKWFRDLALEDPVLDALKLFPIIRQKATTLLVRKTVTKKDEGAELFVRPDASNVALALRSERWFEENFGPFLRHELCHISDMLDETFAYVPEIKLPDAPPAELDLLRDRYRVLWDITIDGRLKHDSEKPKRLAEFTKAFAALPAQRQRETFEQLWSGARPTHPELLELATHVRQVATNIPGATCPLCKFPTFQWASAGDLRFEIVAAIQEHFPKWLPAHGACGRCVELYSTRRLEQPATLFL